MPVTVFDEGEDCPRVGVFYILQDGFDHFVPGFILVAFHVSGESKRKCPVVRL